MQKEFLIKILFVVSACLCIPFMAISAQKATDPVVMTIADKPITLSEFLFIARKDSSVNLENKQSLKDYVELFKTFKLKVADAEALGLNRSSSFEQELNGYRGQLRASFLSDKDGEEIALRKQYERTKEVLVVSQLLFRLPANAISKDTLAIYNKAYSAYQQVESGTSLGEIAEQWMKKDSDLVSYDQHFYLPLLQTPEAFEDAAYALPVGVVSTPVRSTLGFHLIKVEKRIPNPGLIEVAHILINVHEKRDDVEAKKTAQELYNMLQQGADFAELAQKYSSDATASKGGVLPAFGLGAMVKPFEDAAFALAKPGDISLPVKTRYGYHIIKLIEKKGVPSFEDKRSQIYSVMKSDEHNFALYASFDEKMKKAYHYKFYADAYGDFQRLCDEYFPTDTMFYELSKDWKKPILSLDGKDHLQEEFAYYLYRFPFSTKSYSGDFMKEVFDLFVRDLYTGLEREQLDANHPEFDHLMQEYHDGILLFDISNQRVWSKPADQQEQLEKEWIQELREKYPVTVNWKILNKIKSYIGK